MDVAVPQYHGSSAPPNSDRRLWIHVSSRSRRVAGPGKRHSARGAPRAQPRDVRSAGRDTWNLTGEALGGPRKRSWRRCSRARSGRLSAIRGAHSGALDRPEPSDRAARAPIRTRAPYSAADASGSSSAAGARRLPRGSRRAVGAAGGIGTCSTRSGRSRRSDRTVGTPAPPRQVASAGAGAVLSPPAARCRRPRVGRAGAGSRRHRRPRGRRHLPRRHQLSARLAARGRSVRRSLRPAP